MPYIHTVGSVEAPLCLPCGKKPHFIHPSIHPFIYIARFSSARPRVHSSRTRLTRHGTRRGTRAVQHLAASLRTWNWPLDDRWAWRGLGCVASIILAKHFAHGRLHRRNIAWRVKLLFMLEVGVGANVGDGQGSLIQSVPSKTQLSARRAVAAHCHRVEGSR